MNERLPHLASPEEVLHEESSPSFGSGDAPLPPALDFLHSPLAFGGAIVVVLALALILLFLQDDVRPDELTEAEVERLIAEPPERTALPALWKMPTRPSDLRLTTSPAGAAVQINGEWAGRTPLRLDGIRPGFYTITFQDADRAVLDTSFYLASGTFLHLDIPLQPDGTAPRAVAAASTEQRRTSTEQRRTSQERRRIAQRGRPAGDGTPSDPGSTSGQAEFETASPEVLQRISHTGSISVSSTPSGADVLVDRVPFGQAPLSVSGLRPGTYTVTLTLPDHPPLSYQAAVTAQGVSVVEATFPSE